MPASMMIACVALSPKVTGSRIEMPDERADARQHADQRADQAAEKGVPEIVGLEGDGKSVQPD